MLYKIKIKKIKTQNAVICETHILFTIENSKKSNVTAETFYYFMKKYLIFNLIARH